MQSRTPFIGLQFYSLRDAMASDWQATLRQVADTGYLGVETAGFDHASPAVTKAFCDELGLTIIAAHQPVPDVQNQDQVLATMRALGCRRLICAGSGSDQFGSLDSVRARAQTFNEANAIAKSNQLEFGLHNHWWEFSPVQDRLAYDVLQDTLDEDIFF